MTTETILTEELIDQLSDKYLWGHAQFVGAGSVFVEGTEEFARAIEQAVLQSLEVQAWKRDANRYRAIRDVFYAQGSRAFYEIEIGATPSHDTEEAIRILFDDAIDAAMEQQT